jgi:hypothetical protein
VSEPVLTRPCVPPGTVRYRVTGADFEVVTIEVHQTLASHDEIVFLFAFRVLMPADGGMGWDLDVDQEMRTGLEVIPGSESDGIDRADLEFDD